MRKPLIKLSSKEMRALNYIRAHGSITQKDASEDLGDMRLAVTISGLRDKGYNIETLMEDATNRYGEPTRYGRYVLHSD